jgi:hypothetical protein
MTLKLMLWNVTKIYCCITSPMCSTGKTWEFILLIGRHTHTWLPWPWEGLYPRGNFICKMGFDTSAPKSDVNPLTLTLWTWISKLAHSVQFQAFCFYFQTSNCQRKFNVEREHDFYACQSI